MTTHRHLGRETTYLIHCERHYYAGALGVAESGPVKDDYGRPVLFAQRVNAEAWVERHRNQRGPSYLQRGEHSLPTYTVRPTPEAPLATE